MPPAKKPTPLKRTTMWVDPAVLERADAVASSKYACSRSRLIAWYIEEGLKRDERQTKPVKLAAEGAFA